MPSSSASVFPSYTLRGLHSAVPVSYQISYMWELRALVHLCSKKTVLKELPALFSYFNPEGSFPGDLSTNSLLKVFFSNIQGLHFTLHMYVNIYSS